MSRHGILNHSEVSMTTANATHSARMGRRRCTRRLAEGWEEAGDTEVDETWSWMEEPEVWEGKNPQITAQADGAEDMKGGRAGVWLGHSEEGG